MFDFVIFERTERIERTERFLKSVFPAIGGNVLFFFIFQIFKIERNEVFTMSIGANTPDRVKTELNLAIAEAARNYQKANDRYFSRNRILDLDIYHADQ